MNLMIVTDAKTNQEVRINPEKVIKICTSQFAISEPYNYVNLDGGSTVRVAMPLPDLEKLWKEALHADFEG